MVLRVLIFFLFSISLPAYFLSPMQGAPRPPAVEPIGCPHHQQARRSPHEDVGLREVLRDLVPHAELVARREPRAMALVAEATASGRKAGSLPEVSSGMKLRMSFVYHHWHRSTAIPFPSSYFFSCLHSLSLSSLYIFTVFKRFVILLPLFIAPSLYLFRSPFSYHSSKTGAQA